MTICAALRCGRTICGRRTRSHGAGLEQGGQVGSFQAASNILKQRWACQDIGMFTRCRVVSCSPFPHSVPASIQLWPDTVLTL